MWEATGLKRGGRPIFGTDSASILGNVPQSCLGITSREALDTLPSCVTALEMYGPTKDILTSYTGHKSGLWELGRGENMSSGGTIMGGPIAVARGQAIWLCHPNKTAHNGRDEKCVSTREGLRVLNMTNSCSAESKPQNVWRSSGSWPKGPGFNDGGDESSY